MTQKSNARLISALLLGITSASAGTLIADATADAKAQFDKTYGQAVRGVKTTRTSSDDAKLAIVLLDAAKAESGNSAYRVHLLEQAYEFGKLHTDGMRAAADALQELSRAVPRRQLESQEKLLDLYEIVFRNAAGKSDKDVHKKAGSATTDLIIEIAEAKKKRAEYGSAVALLNKGTGIARAVAYTSRQNEIKGLIDEMTPLVPIDSKVQAARRALDRNPADKDAARSLTDLYLKDLDRPVTATTYAALIHDAATMSLFELAGRSVGDLTAEEAMRLATWYLSLAETGSAGAKTNMLIRAKVYCEQTISSKPDDAGAKAMLAKVDLTLVGLKVDGAKATALAQSRRDRLGISVAVRPVEPKPVPKPPIEDPVKPVKPVDPAPAPEPAPAVEMEPKRTEPEFRQEVLTDEYWKNRKSIFDF